MSWGACGVSFGSLTVSWVSGLRHVIGMPWGAMGCALVVEWGALGLPWSGSDTGLVWGTFGVSLGVFEVS